MDQILNVGSAIQSGASVGSILAILKLAAGESTMESLFQSLIDGLMNFVQFLFSSLA